MAVFGSTQHIFLRTLYMHAGSGAVCGEISVDRADWSSKKVNNKIKEMQV